MLEKERAARERAHRDVERLYESDDDVGKTIAATNERLKKQYRSGGTRARRSELEHSATESAPH